MRPYFGSPQGVQFVGNRPTVPYSYQQFPYPPYGPEYVFQQFPYNPYMGQLYGIPGPFGQMGMPPYGSPGYRALQGSVPMSPAPGHQKVNDTNMKANL